MPNWVRIISVAVFAASFVLGMGLVSWYEIWEVPNDTALATLIAIVVKGEAVSVVSAAFAGVIEGGAYIVVIASYLVQKSRREGRAERKHMPTLEGRWLPTTSACRKHANAAKSSTNRLPPSEKTKAKTNARRYLYPAGGDGGTGGIGGTSGPVPFSVGNINFRTG